jgi:hypothetical protein
MCKCIQCPLLHFARVQGLTAMITNTMGPREQSRSLAHTCVFSHAYRYLPIVVLVPSWLMEAATALARAWALVKSVVVAHSIPNAVLRWCSSVI